MSSGKDPVGLALVLVGYWVGATPPVAHSWGDPFLRGRRWYGYRIVGSGELTGYLCLDRLGAKIAYN